MHAFLECSSCCHVAVQLAASIGAPAKHINAHVDISRAVARFQSCHGWSLCLHSAHGSPCSHFRAHMQLSFRLRKISYTGMPSDMLHALSTMMVACAGSLSEQESDTFQA